MAIKEIKIKYLPGATKLKKIDKGCWIDIYAYKDYDLLKGEYKLISLGVAMELPLGYEGHLAPRSSTFKTWKVLQTNSVGVIDGSFKGDNDIWHLPVFATDDTTIKKGDKIAQFRIMEIQPEIKFVEVESLDNEERGSFGSTGEK